MKKTTALTVLVFVSIMLLGGPLMAEEQGAGAAPKDGKCPKCPKCAMMGDKMMKPSLVATSDGGIVMLSANKLQKYDKNLNLVKEVETKMDMPWMGSDGMKMKKQCPMWQHPDMEPGAGEAAPAETKTATEKTE